MIIITIGITTDSYIVTMFVDSSLERLGCRHADCAIQPLGVSDGGFRVEGLERSGYISSGPEATLWQASLF